MSDGAIDHRLPSQVGHAFSMRLVAEFILSRTVGALNAIIRLSSDIDSYRAVSPSRMSEDKDTGTGNPFRFG
jgi:hypothetical protein